LRNKDRILGKDPTPEEIQQQQAEAEQNAQVQQMQQAAFQVDLQAKSAKAQKDTADAEAQNIENQVVVAGFDNIMFDKQSDSMKKAGDAAMSQAKAVQTDVETRLLLTDPAPKKVAVI